MVDEFPNSPLAVDLHVVLAQLAGAARIVTALNGSAHILPPDSLKYLPCDLLRLLPLTILLQLYPSLCQ